MRRDGYGPEAWRLDDLDDPAALAAGIVALGLPGVTDVVPCESTVVVRCDRRVADEVGERLDGVSALGPGAAPAEPLVVDVSYDGEDLPAVAAAIGVSVEEVIRRHADARYTVAFCGFSPGFGYLRGLDPLLHLPRRDVPRTLVPAGSVAIAAGYAAVYPRATPGGWHLLGRTTARLWDPAADPPAAMTPGRAVHFRRVAP
jgi:KipI family sensor histidine kinase inhibitor